ncbi:proline iminopeptidase [Euphorbia peplus]|nr:proline iminopeptidase [Euphorbia peplus]
MMLLSFPISSSSLPPCSIRFLKINPSLPHPCSIIIIIITTSTKLRVTRVEPFGSGFLKVSDLHTIYYQHSGNPTGHEEELRLVIVDSLIQNFTESFYLIRYIVLRKKEIDWFYEGGAAAIYPDAWEPFRDLIPEAGRGCFVDAYSKRLNSKDMETQYAAARAWTKWEMMTAHLLPNEENIKRGDDDIFSLTFARIENHYFVNKGFFSSDSFLLDNIDKIRHIPAVIVQTLTGMLEFI